MKTDAQSSTGGHRLVTATCGIIGLVGNIAAVWLLRHVPHTYKPGDLEAWYTESLANPGESLASSVCFTVGLVGLAIFARMLPDALQNKSPLMRLGSLLLTFGAMLDAVGTPAVAIVVTRPTDLSAAKALLGFTLALDATFNLLLGLALLSFALVNTWPRWLRIFSAVAGVASVPVAGQLVSDTYANLLVISGPLWLLWVLIVCVRLLVDALRAPQPG